MHTPNTVVKLVTAISRALAVIIVVGGGMASGADAKTDANEAPPNAQAVEGSYYRGRGLAYNLDLTLKPDGKYAAKWHSCLYKSGEASGTWRLSGESITFAPPVEGEMLKSPLKRVDVRKFGDEWILVPTDQQDRELYEKDGVTPFSCFQRIDTHARWAGTWHYENGAMGEFHTLQLGKEGDFSWILRDEPLRVEDTYQGKWQVEDGTLHLSFVSGQTKSGEAIARKQPKMVLHMSFDRESLTQPGGSNFRLERTKPKSESR